MEKSKAEESPWSKKKNKKEILDQRRKKERVPFCQEKKKIPLGEFGSGFLICGVPFEQILFQISDLSNPL